MQGKSTRDTVRDIIAEQLGTHNMDEYDDETNLETDLGADSLDLVEITTALEQFLGCELTAGEVEHLATIHDWIKVAENHQPQ